MKLSRKQSTQRRHRRIRRKLSGTAERPRLAVFRSNMHIYVQAIDDATDRTLASASTLDADIKSQGLSSATGDASTAVGKLVAERLKAKGIDSVIFDRGGNLYHGRVKALADAAREAGLNF
ncbi:MAG: 50S ribosomal protein L18 [Oscillatoriales cyanobacterium]|nr:MAG: 50S ribosomal protein L18 [Oscillatoriales cyanobacterium]